MFLKIFHKNPNPILKFLEKQSFLFPHTSKKNFKNINNFFENNNLSAPTIIRNRIIHDRLVLSNISNINPEIYTKKQNISSTNEGSFFQFSLDHLHNLNLEQLLNYYLYNHENFKEEHIDYFIYLFCTKVEFTNKLFIKTNNLDQHKAVDLIWDYFLKNYKNVDNINDCNKFFYLFYIYFRKFSFNSNDFLGKFFNKNNLIFFYSMAKKYLDLSNSEISTGQLLNLLTLVGYFKSTNYYEYLKLREDEVDKIPYWTLRRLLVRLNQNLKDDKNARQIINMIIFPLTRDLTSLDILEKSFLIKNISLINHKIILVASMKKIFNSLYKEIIEYFDKLPENFEINYEVNALFLNISQAVRFCEQYVDLNSFERILIKYINAVENYYRITDMALKNNNKLEEKFYDTKNQSSKTERSDYAIINPDILKEINKDTNISDFKNKINLLNKDFIEDDVEEVNEFDLKLRVFKNNIDEDFDFFHNKEISNNINDNLKIKNFTDDERNSENNSVIKKNDSFINATLDKLDNLIEGDKLKIPMPINHDKINKENDTETFLNEEDFELTIQEKKETFLGQEISRKFDLTKNLNSLLLNFLLTFFQVQSLKKSIFENDKNFAVKFLNLFKKSFKGMDLLILKEKINLNLMFSAFNLMNRYEICDKEIFEFILENFSDKLIDTIIFDFYFDFIEWKEKNLNIEEKKNFENKISKTFIFYVRKDFTIYNFFRIVNTVCIISKKKTVLTDNLHFELISLLEIEEHIDLYMKIFVDFIKNFYFRLNPDYAKNFTSFVLTKIFSKQLVLAKNRVGIIEFYLALLIIDPKNFDIVSDKKLLNNYKKFIHYLENSPFYQTELFMIVKFIYKNINEYKELHYQGGLLIFLNKLENFIKDEKMFLDFDIDRYLIYIALTLIKMNAKLELIAKCCEIVDMIFERNNKCLDFNITESYSCFEKLLEKNIICKSLIKNFLKNIKHFKNLRNTESLILDDQSTVDINLINFKYQNVECNKDSINSLLNTLKEFNVINDKLYEDLLFD